MPIIRDNEPRCLRLAIDPKGREFIQVGFYCSQGANNWIEWEELKRVKVDFEGREISDD